MEDAEFQDLLKDVTGNWKEELEYWSSLSLEQTLQICEALKRNEKMWFATLYPETLGPQEAIAIKNMLLANQSLTAIHIQAYGVIDWVNLEVVLEGIAQNPRIKTIHLDRIDIQDVQARRLSDVVLHNSITCLGLDNGYISESAIRILMDGVNDAPSLERLVLNVGLDRSSYAIILEAIACNRTLYTLEMSGNRNSRLGDAGAELVAKMLESNYTLENLSLPYQEIESEGFKAIIQALRHNEGLVSLNISHNPFHGHYVDELQMHDSKYPHLLYVHEDAYGGSSKGLNKIKARGLAERIHAEYDNSSESCTVRNIACDWLNSISHKSDKKQNMALTILNNLTGQEATSVRKLNNKILKTIDSRTKLKQLWQSIDAVDSKELSLDNPLRARKEYFFDLKDCDELITRFAAVRSLLRTDFRVSREWIDTTFSDIFSRYLSSLSDKNKILDGYYKITQLGYFDVVLNHATSNYGRVNAEILLHSKDIEAPRMMDILAMQRRLPDIFNYKVMSTQHVELHDKVWSMLTEEQQKQVPYYEPMITSLNQQVFMSLSVSHSPKNRTWTEALQKTKAVSAKGR